MRVDLAGINVPTSVLDDILSELPSERQEFYRPKLTPTVISAAYARISRDPRDVDLLLKDAIENVEGAKKSNQQIVFGMSHHSVADHAIFNFNMIGVSRLLIEEIEARRIAAGYTEKSQRYITLDGDFVEPQEFSVPDLEKFRGLVEFQNTFYYKQLDKIMDNLKKKYPKKPESSLEGIAKEDARYGLSLATQAQLGCSYCGETAEHAIKLLKQSDLAEGRELAERLTTELKDHLAIVQLIDKKTFEKFNPGIKLDENSYLHTRETLQELAEEAFRVISPAHLNLEYCGQDGGVVGVKGRSVDSSTIASILFANSKRSLVDCYCIAERMSLEEEKDFIATALQHLGMHDKAPREFEIGGADFMFSAEISSSCFAQLKRHRMMTLLSQDYNPELGIVVPESIREIGAENALREVAQRSTDLYNEFKPKYGRAAEYCLTNSHKRGVLVGANMREVYHISRMREDAHAQWEIRNFANSITRLSKEIAPASSLLLGGKHEFDKVRTEVYKE